MEATTTAVVTKDGQASELATTRRRHRTGKKRLRFGVPIAMPPGVRELWRVAPSEEQERAHRTCVQILSMWLGKARREEVAERLEIPPLRVWQLSQQALAGMLAGLLKQPRARAAREVTMGRASDEDPRVLKKKIAQLEQRLRDQEDLIQLLAELPKVLPPDTTTPTTSSPAAKRRPGPGARAREDGGGRVSGDAPPAAR